ncbi:MAG: glycoside hydrolase family 38 C-terminal domain-containing protein [Eubacteriales bacterium]|nr:glycoside hydrolase family 38 C-terminal domain-containing protein [Eubacteriales bacterium]
MNLSARFVELKKQVGGNREKRCFEHTMGLDVAEKNGITGPSASIRRILSEVNFALQLSKRQEGRFDAEIARALDVLEARMREDGVLTNAACAEAEACLMPLTNEAKAYEVIYASHAHIDMNWMWGWQETVAVTLSTFRTMLNLMREYPEFTYSQSQASVYKIVEEYAPDMMREIQARIREGRWEVTANAWVETDKNMPDTESLIRHIRATREYLQTVWGIEPDSVKVDFSPDTFGHSRFVPEINTFGGVPYYYHCRGLQDDLTLYRYRAPSGSEVLMYKEPYWYNSGVNPDNGTGVFEIERRCAGLKTALIVYGVGNHGGGPTRRDVETVLEMRQWPVFPKLRFGTLHEFFRKAEAVREQLPVVDHELNAIFTGCYTTQSRIKLANRRTEAALLDSERMNAMAHCALGLEFPAKRYEAAWQKMLFTHFHDILTGSCVQESREYAMGRLAEALACAQTEQAHAYEALSQAVDTSMFPADDGIARSQSEGAGAGYGIAHYAGVPNPERGVGKVRVYTVFNAAPMPRKETVEITVWDYVGNLDALEVVDHENKPVAFQMLDTVSQKYWDHEYVRMLIQADVPAMGYGVYAVREREIQEYPTHLLKAEREELPKERLSLENSRIRAEFDTGSGQLFSLVDKTSGRELLSAPAGLTLVRTENGGMTAWRIGRYLGMEPVTDTVRVSQEKGALRDSIAFEQRIMHSTVKMTVSLDADADALKYDLEVDWHETAREQEFLPVLSYRLPLREAADAIRTDVPGGSAVRPARQIDVPALTGACAVSDQTTAALITDCKYGFRLAENVLSVTLINTSCDPDPYPERGIHAIKLFVCLTDGAPDALKHKAEALTRPMVGVPTAVHPGALPPKNSLLAFESAHAVLTSVEISRDDALVVRLYASEQEDAVAIRPPFAPASAVLTDLDGNPLENARVEGEWVRFSVQPYRIAQVKIYRA